MVRAWIVWFVALNLAWYLLISTFVLAEEVLGLFASALAATAAVALQGQQLFRFRARLAWIVPAWRLPWRTVVETGWVLGALGRQLAGGKKTRGSFERVPVSLPDDPSEAATKRALLTAGLSFPPNSYVLEIDSERQEMILHQLIDPEHRVSSYYLIAAAALLLQIGPLLVFSVTAKPQDGLVALNVGGDIATLVLLLLAAGTGREPFFDLAIVSAVLSFAGGLAYARFLERWL